jgi:murein DD-endopeptidase MepM/ murein hydrolase activator NlpD
MRPSTYRYNPLTCRYEPVSRGARHALFPVLIFMSVSTGLFIALILLHSQWITTDKELTLKQENAILLDYHTSLRQELGMINSSLASLQEADQKLQEKLITGVSTPVPGTFSNPVSRKVDVDERLQKVTLKANTLLQRTKNNNQYFGHNISLRTEDLTLLNSIPALQPIEKQALTQLACGYGLRKNPYHNGNYFHKGIDLVAVRRTPVLASAPGKILDVRRSELEMGEGNVIVIDHGNGYKTRYTHLGEILVKPGQRIDKGATIATIGMSGGSVSPHLHYEILKNNKHVDPIEYLMEGVTSNDYKILHHQANQKNQSLD